MSSWIELKASARAFRQTAEDVAGPSATLWDVLRAALQLTHVDVESCPHDDPLLHGGDARLEVPDDEDDCPVVYYRADAPEGDRLFLIAHELAHSRLHTGGFWGDEETFEPHASEEAIPESTTEPYSPRSLQERQANVWAREFLLPASALRSRFLGERVTASDIVEETGLDSRLVRRQMARALLTVESAGQGEVERTLLTLNDRQREAAHAECGPLLVMAGPGTGKTSTLTARVSYLLDRGVTPEDIVCLTFSRKAAQEMRERIAAQHPEQAPALRIDTIHAFCCDILRRETEGAEDQVKVLDTPRQRAVLESLLPQLPLVHFQYLPDPSARLGDILRIIGRAKCDLVGPDEFMKHAADQLEEARRRGGDVEWRRAEKIMEVAEVYRRYQADLTNRGYYDYGDLVVKTVELFEDRPDVRSRVQGQKHLLVDEYQDLNTAGLRFVKLLAGDGERLWAVGDPCQAIYRFRGASTSGILSFRNHYPTAPEPVVLDVNYRSRQEVIDFFGAMPASMDAWKGLGDPPRWTSNHGTGGGVIFRLAESPESEFAGMAKAIKYFQSEKGVDYLDQAVLARSHKHLARIAQALEEEDVPVLFLSGFFEREVVRDLLALLETTTAGARYHALLRVCAFPEYGVPEDDVRRLVEAAQQAECDTTYDALRLAPTIETLSENGQRGLGLLLGHIGGIGFPDHPWLVLADYLFEGSRYLEALPPDDDTDNPVLNQRRRVALFQLLQIAHGYTPPPSGDPRRGFLEWVRRLALSSEYRHLAQVPPWAASIDAVRLMTAHAAKGLEFDAVCVPMLNEWGFQKLPLPEPPTYPETLRSNSYEQDVTEEEQCLFFVAASRARRYLLLSRANLRYNARGQLISADPSVPLRRVPGALRGRITGEPHWPGHPEGPMLPDRTPLEDPPTYTLAKLNTYLDCPRRYHYGRIFGLHERADPSPYLTLIGLVRDAIKDALDALSRDEPIDPQSLIDDAQAKWGAGEFSDHFYASHYKDELSLRIGRIADLIEDGVRPEFPSFEVSRPKGTITLEPDVMLVDEGGRSRLRRWTAGAIHWSESHRPYYWLLREGAIEAGISSPILEAVSCASHHVEQINLNRRAREEMAERIDAALDGLARGDYPPRPDDNRCPSCPFFFACQTEKND